jgi:diguanylate cyclase (GGDEF)-like protein
MVGFSTGLGERDRHMYEIPNSRGCKVLVVDDQRSTRLSLAHVLAKAGYPVIEAHSGETALEVFKSARPDIVLLDIEMPGRDGYWVARQLRESEAGGWTPIIFVSGRGMDLNLWEGIEAGGDDYLVKPISSVVLLAKLHAMQRLIEMRRRLVDVANELRMANLKLSHMNETDGLTGLLNRRGLDLRLNDEIDAARTNGLHLTLFMCDVDYFKRYNDSLGHQAGDECLTALAEIFRQACHRKGHYACRYGGEEFALVLSDTPRTGALTFARAIMNLLKARSLVHPQSEAGPLVTISGGITTCVPDDTTTAEILLQRADEALYTAKGRGRNRFFSYEMQVEALLKGELVG